MRISEIKVYPEKRICFYVNVGSDFEKVLPVLEDMRTMYLNIEEIQFMFPVKEVEMFSRMDGELLSDGQWTLKKELMPEKFGLYTNDYVMKSSLIQNVEVGIVVLKHGVSTNLGLNGMDVAQKLYVEKEAFEKMLRGIVEIEHV